MTNQTGPLASENVSADAPPSSAGSAQPIKQMRRPVVRRGAWRHWVEALRRREVLDEMDAQTSLAAQSTSAVALAIEAVRRLDDPPQPVPPLAPAPETQPPEDSHPPT